SLRGPYCRAASLVSTISSSADGMTWTPYRTRIPRLARREVRRRCQPIRGALGLRPGEQRCGLMDEPLDRDARGPREGRVGRWPFRARAVGSVLSPLRGPFHPRPRLLGMAEPMVSHGEEATVDHVNALAPGTIRLVEAP